MVQKAKRTFLWIISFLSLRDEKGAAAKGGKGNIAALDGVRAIAALLVVTLHLNEYAGVPWNLNGNAFLTGLAVFGRTGVDLFFVLSGFLLFLPFTKALLFQEKWPSTRNFYLRRIFRIWPGYYFSLVVIILWDQRQYLQPDHWKELALFLTFFMDSSAHTWQKLNGPFWTLATEWQFYLLLPLIAFCFFHIMKRFRLATPQQRLLGLMGCCASLFILSVAMRGLGVYCLQHPWWTFLIPRQILNFILFFTFGIQGKYLEVFAVGMMVCACYTYANHAQGSEVLKIRLQRWSAWICRAGFIMLLCLTPWQLVANDYRDLAVSPFTALHILRPLSPFYPWLGEPLAGIGYGICVLAILFGSPSLRWFFELPYVCWIGQISYALYMWNQKLLSIAASLIFPHLPAFRDSLLRNISLWTVVFVIILPLCALFYRFVEKPGIRLGNWVISHISEIKLFRRSSQQQLQASGSSEG